MILPASYANGFAPRDGQPIYPELWNSCVFAAAPCLGPTGSTLRDWSRFAIHKTMSNMDIATDWVTSGGRWSLDFETNDYIDLSSTGYLPATTDWTLAAWICIDAIGTEQSIFSQYLPVAGNGRLLLFIDNTGLITLLIGNQGSESTLVLTSAIAAGRLTHVAVTRVGKTFTLYKNGIAVGTSTDSTTRSILQVGNVIGAYPLSTTNYLGSLTSYLNGKCDDIRICKSGFMASQISVLASRRGIAYELAPRRRASTQVVTGNRRRRVLIGAN